MTYRILFTPDGEHWIDSKANNRKDPFEAAMEARQFKQLDPFARIKVINAQTRQVILDE